MSRVKEFTNTSGKAVTVELARGGKVRVAPNEKLENEDVRNVSDLRGKGKVIESLNERM